MTETTATTPRGLLRRLTAWWGRSSTPRRILSVAGVSVLIVGLWVGQGILSVLGQIEPYAQYWRTRAQDPGEVLYVALGDSAAQGIGASDPQQGYVGLLADRIQSETGLTVRVVNLSETGAKVADVLADQVPALRQLQPDIVTLAVGGNDASKTTPDNYAQRLADIVAALPPGSFVADVPDFQGGPRLEAARALSAAARRVIADSPDIVLVDLERATSVNGWSDYAPDFFHPDDSGYVRWADAFWAVIRPAL